MQISLTQDDLTDDQLVFLFSKYSYNASFLTSAEAWVVSEEFDGMGKKKTKNKTGNMEGEGQPALLQLGESRTHLSSLGDNSFLLGFWVEE